MTGNLKLQRRRRRVAGGLIAVPAPPASAVVSKSGTQSCAAGFYVQLVAKGQGDISFYIPTGTFRDVVFNSTIKPAY